MQYVKGDYVKDGERTVTLKQLDELLCKVSLSIHVRDPAFGKVDDALKHVGQSLLYLSAAPSGGTPHE